MKKLLALFLVGILLATTLTGCNRFQQQNTTLTLYAYEHTNWGRKLTDTRIQSVLSQFEETHPQVTVNIVEKPLLHNDEQTKLETELMAGKGPDLLLMSDWDFPDFYKTMQVGTFCDLSPFMKRDKEFQQEDYYEQVLTAGTIENKQYAFPISFNVDTYVTTKEALLETGISTENCNSFLGFWEEIQGYIQRNPSSERRIIDEEYGVTSLLSPVNYQQGMPINILTEEVKNTCQLFKAYDSYDESRYLLRDNHARINGNDYAEIILKKRLIFKREDSGYGALSQMITLSKKETPVLLPRYQQGEGINARVHEFASIPIQSKNQQAAYDFLMQMLRNRSFMSDFGASTVISKEQTISNLQQMKDYAPAGMSLSFFKKYTAEYLAILDQVTDCAFSNNTISIIERNLAPYFKDEASLDDCLQKAQEQLEIYISE